jgi:hypothetical protein
MALVVTFLVLMVSLNNFKILKGGGALAEFVPCFIKQIYWVFPSPNYKLILFEQESEQVSMFRFGVFSSLRIQCTKVGCSCFWIRVGFF